MLKMLKSLSLMVLAALVLMSAWVGCASIPMGGTAPYEYITLGAETPLAVTFPVPAGTPDFTTWDSELVGQMRGTVAEMVAFRYAQIDPETEMMEVYLVVLVGYRTNGTVTKVLPIVLSHCKFETNAEGVMSLVLDENWQISRDLKALYSFPAEVFESRINALFMQYCSPPEEGKA